MRNTYQGLAEGYLARAGSGLGPNTSAKQLSGAGGKFMGEYTGKVSPMMDAARASAFYNPDLVNRAAVDAQMAGDQAMGTATRNMTRMGINPASARYAGLVQDTALKTAAMKAGEMTRANAQERAGESSRLMNAAQLGQNLPGISLSAMQSASASADANAALKAQLEMRKAQEYGDLAAQKQGAESLKKSAQEAETARRMASMKQKMDNMTVDWKNSPGYQKMMTPYKPSWRI